MARAEAQCLVNGPQRLASVPEAEFQLRHARPGEAKLRRTLDCGAGLAQGLGELETGLGVIGFGERG